MKKNQILYQFLNLFKSFKFVNKQGGLKNLRLKIGHCNGNLFKQYESLSSLLKKIRRRNLLNKIKKILKRSQKKLLFA